MTTITGTNQNDNLVGTNGNDTINGRNGNDVIAGLAGNDTIIAGNGNNTITDGDGNDTVTAGNGNNNITVGNGNDHVTVGNGTNTIVAGNGNDTVTAGNGANSITVGNGTDTVTVGNGNNTITAGSGADTINTGNGNNTISAGGGNDVVHTGNGNDTVNAGAGNDQVTLSGGNDVYIYNMSDNIGSHDTADGGRGTDRVQIELTQQQFNSAAVQADLAAYQAFLSAHANPNTDSGTTFHFTAFDLSVTDFEQVNVVIVNSPVVISSGPETADVFELADTTGSAAVDTTATVPSGTLNFSDADTGDTHTVAVTLGTTTWSAGGSVPAGTHTDLATAVTTALHDSTGSGNGSVDWTFAIPDHDVDFLAAGETMTVNYDVAVSDGSTTAHQTVSVTVTGANDAVTVTGGPGSASVSELANTTNSPTLDGTTPVPTGSLAFTDVDLSDAHSVSVALTSATWSFDPFASLPAETLSDLQTALATVLHDSTGSGSGTVDWTFAIPDRDLDFLSSGETLTATYDVTVSDGFTTSTQTVTITMSGADDALVAAPVSVAVTDSPFPDAGVAVAAGLLDDLAHAIDSSSTRTVTEVNSSSANVGHPVAGTNGTLFLNSDGSYSYIANSAFDPLQVGDNPSDQFTFTIADNHGHTSTSTLTFNIAGGDDNPVITASAATGSVTEDAGPTVLANGGFETGTLSGWTTVGPGISVEQLELGGGFGHYTARLTASGGASLSQDVSTTPGQHYFLSFTVIGDTEATNSPFSVSWDGVTLLSLSDVPIGVNNYTFDVVGDGLLSTTALQFSYADDGTGLLLDQISVNPATGPATESTDGSISFSDVETADTHTAGFTPLGSGYLGTFSLDPVSESGGSGSVAWHFTVSNADIQFLAAGQTLTQDYLVTVSDNHGGSATQDVSVTMVGTNDAPTAVGETVISDAGSPGLIDIPAWALAMNDTDPDATDHVFVNSIGTSTGGSATPFGDIFFSDDSTPGGSFTYNSSDGTATSSNFATATVVNNPTSATSLDGTSGDDIIIASGNSETMSGGGGNDILIGASGSHVMTGGSGNDSFAFLNTSAGPGVITDFNNTTESDHIVISASGFGGGLTPGMNVSSTFETSGDDQFSGFGAQFHFDTANNTLYYSADGTQANANAVTTVQSGVTINPHDLIIV